MLDNLPRHASVARETNYVNLSRMCIYLIKNGEELSISNSNSKYEIEILNMQCR